MKHQIILTLTLIALLLTIPLLATACAPAEAAWGSKERPIKMAIIPYVETQKLVTAFQPFVDLLEKETGYKIEFSVPSSDAATIEAMGAKKLDVAWFGPLAYVLAHDKYGADVILVSVQKGATSYRGMIIVRADSGFKTVADLKGKRFAFSSPTSTSGYLYPAYVFIQQGMNPKTFFQEYTFAGGHDKAAIAVYNKQVEGAAVYEDVRENLLQTFPDAMTVLKPIAYTEWIPNDNVAVGQHVPADVKEKIKAALIKVVNTPEGKKALVEAIGTERLDPIQDSAYNPVRETAKAMGINLDELLPKPK